MSLGFLSQGLPGFGIGYGGGYRTGFQTPGFGDGILDMSGMAPMGGVDITKALGAKPAGGLGLNMDTAGLALSGLGTIGNLWAAFQSQKLAKEQFKYTKGVTETNLTNSIKNYNTQLTDRANNRAIVEGRTPDQTKAYIDANSFTRYGR